MPPRRIRLDDISSLPDHQNRERTRDRGGPVHRPPSGGWRRWRRPSLLAHRQDVVRLAVERDRSGAIHRLQILLDLETRRALLLDDSQRAVAMRAEGFHRRRIEHRAIRPAGERQTRENLAVLRRSESPSSAAPAAPADFPSWRTPRTALVLRVQTPARCTRLCRRTDSAPTAFIVLTSTAVTLPCASCMTT